MCTIRNCLTNQKRPKKSEVLRNSLKKLQKKVIEIEVNDKKKMFESRSIHTVFQEAFYSVFFSRIRFFNHLYDRKFSNCLTKRKNAQITLNSNLVYFSNHSTEKSKHFERLMKSRFDFEERCWFFSLSHSFDMASHFWIDECCEPYHCIQFERFSH